MSRRIILTEKVSINSCQRYGCAAGTLLVEFSGENFPRADVGGLAKSLGLQHRVVNFQGRSHPSNFSIDPALVLRILDEALESSISEFLENFLSLPVPPVGQGFCYSFQDFVSSGFDTVDRLLYDFKVMQPYHNCVCELTYHPGKRPH